MARVTIHHIVKTSIVTAFTIAAAFIWKDVIIEIIEVVVPASEALFYKFLAAILATVFVVIAIYAILKTDYGAGLAVKKIKERRAKSNTAKQKPSQAKQKSR